MNAQEQFPYERMIFVCVNDKKKDGPSCGDHQGGAIFEELRRLAKEKGVHPRIRVSQAKCLGKCAMGCNVMVYPEQMWIHDVHLEDVPKIAEQYL